MNQCEPPVTPISKSDSALDVLSLYFSGDGAMALDLINSSSPERLVVNIDFEVALECLISPFSKRAPSMTTIK